MPAARIPLSLILLLCRRLDRGDRPATMGPMSLALTAMLPNSGGRTWGG
jgi:hypothetical protein